MKKKLLLKPVQVYLPLYIKILRVMRLTLFLFFISFIQVFAGSAYSQATRISLNLKNSTIKDVLYDIESKSEYYFLFNSQLVNVDRRVDIEASNEKIEQVLDRLFEGQDVGYTIMDRQIIIQPSSMVPGKSVQQNKTISGKVTDSSESPIPGVSVVVKNTTIGTITDNNGKYTLPNIPDNVILQFSFVGMRTQEIKVEGKFVIDVKMQEESIGIEEVVAVGYGTIKKGNLTGAVSAIKIDDKITSRSLPNVSSGLSGLIPGLTVSQNSGMAGKNDVSLLIRGLGTVNNANPLIVVDGMPDVDINRINMNDVESVSVLKDAASSAIYGSRAANGVILITTKTGKGMKKTTVTFSSSFTTGVPTSTLSFMTDYPRALTLEQRAAAVGTLRSNWVYKDGTIDQWMALGMIDPLRYPNTDWWDITMRNSNVQNNNLSLTGGTERSNFFISIGSMDEKGLQIDNDYSRYNARFNYDYKIRDNMNVGVRFSGNWSKFIWGMEDGFTDDTENTGGFDIYTAVAGITPYDPVTGYYGGIMAYNENPQLFNPLVYFHQNLTHESRQEVNPSFYLDWSPIKGLTARIDYTLNYYNEFSYNAPTPTRAYNFQTNSYGSRVYFGDNAGISNYTYTGYKTMLGGQLNYEKVIARNHELKALFVYNEEYWYNRSQSASRNDRLHPSLHEINAALTDVISNGGSSNTEGLRSYISRINYTAYDKYLFEASFRYDGSSKFLPGSQFGFFPSASLGWKFTEENFIKPLTQGWLNSGKLRISYGGLGNNSGVGRYEQQETLGTSNYMIGGGITKGFVNKKMVNKDLSWETTNVMNIGLDLAFLESRLTAEVDYYDRLTTGMNRPSDLSMLLSGGYDAPRRNIGDLRNRGIEGNFTWRNKVGSFNYSVNLNVSYNRTVLEKWNEYLGRGATSSSNYVFIDMPYNYVYTYVDKGIAQTWQDVYDATPQNAQPGDIIRLDLNGDGRISDEDRKADPNHQRKLPTTNYGLNVNMSWKGLDLAVLFQGAAGRKEFWLTGFNNVDFGLNGFAPDWAHWDNPWSVENRDGIWPRLRGNNNRTETTFWLDDLSYLRLKNVQLGYTVPKSLMKLGLNNVRIYGSAENLVTFTKFRGLDPEKVAHVSDAYPLVKSFTFGIIVGF
ncbi:MAG: SusC/RagA family TonB-linked outer membrane protein [Bacteroidetes bacterium GWA2_42_15]|nr:MAG: SusC/RagA family TonB-linked outer membrane protein [Bacteroidetes bacterium GWA2_42_15]